MALFFCVCYNFDEYFYFLAMQKGRTITTQIDSTNLAADTYYYTISSDRLSSVSVMMECSGGVTVTFEGTIEDPATGTWIDITEAASSLLTGASSFASFVDQTDIVDYDSLRLRGFRVKVVTSDNTNAVKIITAVENDVVSVSV